MWVKWAIDLCEKQKLNLLTAIETHKSIQNNQYDKKSLKILKNKEFDS